MYDFTSILNREGMDAIAVNPGKGSFLDGITIKEGFDKIPMWIADMNFPTLPDIQEKIIERVKHPAFGYFNILDEYYQGVIDWQLQRNNIKVEKENIGYENGVLGGVASALNVFCSKGDKVLVNSPTYIGFTKTLTNNGYNIILSNMYLDEQGTWRLDYQDMEDKIVKEKIHAAIFCSPHNPTGRVWEKEEIEKVMEIFKKHDVMVVSDEIWSDMILKGYKHIPTASVSEDAKNRTVSLYAPSKTFNLAGLVGSYHIVYNEALHDKIKKESSLSHYNSINVLSMHSLIAAYSKNGQKWLDELIEVLTGNVDFAYDYILKNFKGVTLSKPQGTYMLFLDCKEFCLSNNITLDELLKEGFEVGVLWQDGRPFHGEYSIRMNLALPISRVKEAFDRLNKYVFNK